MADDTKTWRGEFCDFVDSRGNCRNPYGCSCDTIKKDRNRITALQDQNRKLVEALAWYEDEMCEERGQPTVCDTALIVDQ